MGYFDYLIPARLIDKIKSGDFVYIPFKNQILSGLVTSFTDKSEFSAIKEVSDLHNTLSPFLPYQLDLLNWFSEYYHYSLGSTLKLFLMELPKKTAKLDEPVSVSSPAAIVSNKNVEKIAEQIICSNKDKKFLLFPLKQAFKSFFFAKLADLCSQDKKQILIIFPQVHKAQEFFKTLPLPLQTQACLFTSTLRTSKNRYFETWRKIRENKINIIIGTRMAIFAPMSKPGLIIIDDAHSDDLRQWDQNPRYDTICVSRKIQELTGCKLILSSIAPRPEDAFLAKKENYHLISLGSSSKQNFKIVDLNDERKKGFTYLSEELISSIKQTLERKKKVLLIVNKKGDFGYLACNDCHYEATCDNCHLPLSVADKNLVCYRCGLKLPMLLSCPDCHGQTLKKFGIGINQIKNELNKIIDQKISILDENSDLTAPILLSTGQNIDRHIFDQVGLLGFVYVDSLAYLSDFNSSFRLYSFLTELMNLFSSNNQAERNVIVQTCFPQNIAFSSLNEGYDKFYQQELAERKAFGYPPLSVLIKLFFEHHDLKVCRDEALNLHDKLCAMLGRRTDITVTDPYPCHTRKVRSRFRYQLVLFLRDCSIEKENDLLTKVPEYWTIDKNPHSLL